jgi:trehalose 6-phosphate synthase
MEPRADLILANRAYLDHETPQERGEGGSPTNGGLLATLRPAFAPWDGARGTTWIGAGRGRFDREFAGRDGLELVETPHGTLRQRRLYFADDAWDGHYAEVANSFTWPLFHLVREPLPEVTEYYPRPEEPGSEQWAKHVAVNQEFATAALGEASARTCWVHDYQLALTPQMLRAGGFRGRIGFFLHTPFPRFDLAERFLNERGRALFGELVRGMLGADLIGFQTEDDRDRFIESAERVGGAELRGGRLSFRGREVRVSAHPAGVDSEGVERAAAQGRLPAAVAAARREGAPFVVGLERCDFTKGIPERLRAVTSAFEGGMEFSYAGVAAPTRAGVAAYAKLERAVETAADEAAAAAGRRGRSFVHLHQTLSWNEVVALEREADVVFTSSLADGMNLVPLQAVIAQERRAPGQRAVLIAGRDAGVARVYREFEGDGLVSIDPLKPEVMLETLVRALRGELPRVSDRLIAEVRKRDAQSWANGFMSELEGRSC